jgi:uncharacterized protein YegL
MTVPVYLVVDVSGSTAPFIHIINDQLVKLLELVMENSRLDDLVRLGVVSFSSDVHVDMSLAPASEVVHIPQLRSFGATRYSAVFRSLATLLSGDVTDLKAGNFRVYRPAVFFLSDGRPTDGRRDWSSALAEVTSSVPGGPRIFSIGMGDASPEVVQQIASDNGLALMTRTGTPTSDAIKAYFGLVVEYLLSFVRSLNASAGNVALALPEGLVQLPTIET